MREHFDLDPNLIYLNSGTHSLCPRVVLEAITADLRSYEKNPTLGIYNAWERLWNVQKKLAHFFQAQAEDLFLRSNITQVLNIFLQGIPLEPQSEILTSDQEYGAIFNIARFRAEQDHLGLRTFKLPFDSESLKRFTAQDWVETVLKALQPKTRLLLLSHVYTGTGFKLPLEILSKETRKKGIFLVVDGAHAPGGIPLDFRTLENVDFYAGNLHKWMMGPKGTAFGWVPKRHQAILKIHDAGWTTFSIPAPFSKFGDAKPFPTRMLHSACQDFSPFFALSEMIDFWHSLTPQAIIFKHNALRCRLERLITSELDWPLLSPSNTELQGPLLSFALPDFLSNRGYELIRHLLEKHHLQVGLPMLNHSFALRLSPHIYNTEEELNQTVKILKHLNNP